MQIGNAGALAKRTIMAALPLALVAAHPGAALAAGPSFDCAKASSSAEKLVCRDETLAALDRETARLFRLALNGKYSTPARRKELRAYQRGWIKGRDDCWKAPDLRACVRDSYAIRIHELRQGYADARSADGKGVSDGPLAMDCQGFGAGIGLTYIRVSTGFAVLQWRRNFRVLKGGPGGVYAGTPGNEPMVLKVDAATATLRMPDGKDFACRVEKVG